MKERVRRIDKYKRGGIKYIIRELVKVQVNSSVSDNLIFKGVLENEKDV